MEPEPQPPTDPTRDLLVGLLAARLGRIGEADLLPALTAWGNDRSRSLADRLVDRGALAPADRVTLDDLATRLSADGGPDDALRRLGLDAGTLAELTLLNDPTIDAVLDRIAPSPAAPAEIPDDAPAAAPAPAPRGRLRRSRDLWRFAAVAAGLLALAALLVLSYVNRDRFEGRRQLAATMQQVRELDAAFVETTARAERRVGAVVDGLGELHASLGRDFLLRQGEFFPVRSRLLARARGVVDRLEDLWGRAPGEDERRSLATAYEQLGDLQRRLGTPDDALVAHRRALWLRRSLVAGQEKPGRDARRDLGRSLLAAGEIEVGAAVPKTARATLSEARALWSNLALSSDPAPPDDSDRLGLARADLALARLASLAGDPSEARAALGRAAFTLDALPANDPRAVEVRVDVEAARAAIETQAGTPHAVLGALLAQRAACETLNRARPGQLETIATLAALEPALGRAFDRVGRPVEATAAFARGIEQTRRLVADYPAISLFRQQLAAAHGLLGAHHEAAGRPEAALGSFSEAVATLDPLATTQPQSTRTQIDASMAGRDLARALAATGKTEKAGVALNQARDHIERIAAVEPTNPAVAREAAAVQAARGAWLLGLKRVDEAGPPIERSRAVRDLLRLDHPDVMAYWQDLAASLALKGRWHEARGERREAAAAYVEAVTNLEHVGLMEPELFYEMAGAAARLAGLGGSPDAGVPADVTRLAADQAVASLRAAAWLGLRAPARLAANPAFDPIRNHPGYPLVIRDWTIPLDPFAAAESSP